MGSAASLASLLAPRNASGFRCTDLPVHHPTRLHATIQSRACLPFCVTPSLKQLLPVQEYQPVVHLLRFLPRITIVAQESLCFRWKGFSPFFSLLIPTFSLPTSPPVLPDQLHPCGNAPLPRALTCTATASVPYFSPGNFRRRVSRPVSYYALFKWWLLLSQHPGCL